jgi:zinc/manganese transport system substrate-binding protein
MQSRRRFLLTLPAVILAGQTWPAGGPANAAPAIDPPPLPVIASFSILADMVRQVGGDRVQVTTLVGPDGDAHVYQPTPTDARVVAAAKVVFVNGLGFEGWIDRLVRAAGFKGPVVVASRGVEVEHMADPDKPGHDHGHDHGELDPHAWQSLSNGQIYVRNITAALIAADPAGRAAYEANARRYQAEIAAVDAETRAAIQTLPPTRRTVITSHDAFGYFSNAYGITFIAPVGVSTDSEASAADVARLIRQIREKQIPAVFMENVSDPRLLAQISRETGARIGGRLYSDALSPPGGPAATYLDMIRSNTRILTQALAS